MPLASAREFQQRVLGTAAVLGTVTARVEIPGLPHHVTQRGNCRQPTFFNPADYEAYLDLLAAGCARTGTADVLEDSAPLLELVPDWMELLALGLSADEARRIRGHEKTGRPLGSDNFVARLERRLLRVLRPQKRGPKPREKAS